MNCITRIGVIGLSAYMFYLAVKCPCEKIMDCSKFEFEAATIGIHLLFFANHLY